MVNLIKRILSTGAVPAILPGLFSPKALQRATKPVVEEQSAASYQEERPMYRYAKLIMVTAKNNNKFYEMKEEANGTFTAYYGRVGGSRSAVKYPMAQWGQKLKEKIRKGYIDQTSMFAERSTVNDFAHIPDAQTRCFIDDLLAYSRQSILRNYKVAAEQVTRKQVDQAQAVLDRLAGMVRLKRMQVKKFNEVLIDLYIIIPRKMSHVQAHLIERPTCEADIKAIQKKLSEEQAMLDVMRGEVEAIEQKRNQEPDKKQTLIQALGIQVEPLLDISLIQDIKRMMGKDSHKFRRAFKVINTHTQKAFDEFVSQSKNQKTELFWHGSRNENWLSILKSGLVLRPANAIISGKMFGYGLYFADKFRKSLNYTSLRGSFWAGGTSNSAYLALYDVHLGHSLKIKKHESWCSKLTAENLKLKGEKYNSVFAKGGVTLRNNEYIIYHQSQCTIRYVVEIGTSMTQS